LLLFLHFIHSFMYTCGMRDENNRAEAVGGLLRDIRRRKMWNQGELAGRAGVSPTTVSGIESGRISRPHLGTIRKLARAMGVEPEILLGGGESATGNEGPSRLSLSWARAAGEEEFERGLDEASLDGLGALSRKLDEERGRLQKLYSAEGSRSFTASSRKVASSRSS